MQHQERDEQLHSFWCSQMESVRDFKSHQLPLTRIKKIMKSDRDVHMISAEAPIVLAKACEMFIFDLTRRSWVHAEESKRRTLQKSDISAAASRTFAFDFLLDVVPRDESALAAAADTSFMPMPHPDAGVTPYYYPPGMVTGIPVAVGGGMYAAPPQDGEEEAGQSGGNSSVDLGV
ncbi:unnamed protein product [Arabis nemorensis]|uniref:Transcription factor CBF/NF-Y/archaeal histone domain-containing protein n=1 Tax=Arabis nemorensis TaxID=586526 RepID=A0A565CQ32_9BRAS|nr:unnamed protein product [Arabis nemorensis]